MATHPTERRHVTPDHTAAGHTGVGPNSTTRETANGDTEGHEWWRTAVIYQIYPRSFADASGDGIGDLAGITDRLDAVAELDVDAIWLSPFFRSPQKDAGYDVSDYRDIDPLFGTLDDFDRMLRAAHDRGIRVIVDLVPNHTSDQHEWFREALVAAPGSEERARYLFRDGRGEHREEPPNNWQSVFGGPAWTRITETDGTPGQWYLHLFDSSQPDLDWSNPWVRQQFLDILRFWLDRGVDGFRVDVAHGMIKADGLPDWEPPLEGGSMGGDLDDAGRAPYWGQEGVHDIYREWRQLLDTYDGDRVLCAEAWVNPPALTALWVRPDEMHQAFNFAYLETPFEASALRAVIDDSIAAFHGVGAPSTWVLSNHDVIRHATRLALTAPSPQGDGIGPESPGLPDPVHGLRRARAATALMLALPGSAYLYQGEELGLPEVIDLPDNARHDPTWHRTNGERYGRDGCRVPIPWEADAPAFGFSDSGTSWLPQPSDWGTFARDQQRGADDSTLELYRRLLELRRSRGTATATLTWNERNEPGLVDFTVGGVRVISNTGDTDAALPSQLTVLLASSPLTSDVLPPDTTVWLTT